MMAVGIGCVTAGGEKLCQVKKRKMMHNNKLAKKKKNDGEGRGQETKVVRVVQQGALKTFHLEPFGEKYAGLLFGRTQNASSAS